MYSSCKRSISRNTTWSAIYISLQWNIPKFDTVLLHSNWSSLRRKYLSKIPTDVNALSCGAKIWNISGISDAISPARYPQKSSQHVRACAAGDGAICSKNRIIVPYHGDNPNTWNGALTVSVPEYGSCFKTISLNNVKESQLNLSAMSRWGVRLLHWGFVQQNGVRVRLIEVSAECRFILQ